MSDYDDELRGVLFPSRDKKTERSPDFTGRATIDGVEYRLAAWKRASRATGKPFLSISFEEQQTIEPGDDAADTSALDL